ncbi:hypothetical protein ONE63_011081 [Megalurothrips usitatus]|uniref:Partial AB-hydrolase lipase domain-containing protein n=1 Tax=Megalurothrips usitatus TaxID=439358 RepID=A0AAV7XJ50_9NEOP|nr:hypothetical protein ONE63_011081 [Megalurothrips usitatus]
MRSATLALALAVTACVTSVRGATVLDNLINTVETAVELIKNGTAAEDNTTTLLFGTRTLIESFGYAVENHTVTTEDCYQLSLFRIPKPGGRPVLFMHGIWESSADWPVPGPGRALPFLLANAGYDVWLGNARGNTESRRSCKYNPDKDPEFWDFSMHEIGTIDLPASIDYILMHTNQSDLHYVGFSQVTLTMNW